MFVFSIPSQGGQTSYDDIENIAVFGQRGMTGTPVFRVIVPNYQNVYCTISLCLYFQTPLATIVRVYHVYLK
jgi:hypothetical protein